MEETVLIKKNELEFAFIIYTFEKISEIGDLFGDYIEYKEKYDELLSKKENDQDIWFDLFDKYSKRVLVDWINALIDAIVNKKHISQNYSKIRSGLLDIKKKIATLDIPHTELMTDYRSKIKKYESEIIENLVIEKTTNRRYWKGIIIGFTLGIIASIIGYFIIIFLNTL